MAILYLGIDLAKNVFALHGVNAAGKPEWVRPKVARAQLHELVAKLAPCTVAMEAYSGAHHWARLFAQHGHMSGSSRRSSSPRTGCRARGARINRIRGLLSEFGIVLPQKAEVVRREAAALLEALARRRQLGHRRPLERAAPAR